MLDETIITETPPLYYAYGHRGKQIAVPISGQHKRRILHGALNVQTGDILLHVTGAWNQLTHQEFLRLIRRHWRGWKIVLFEDRARQPTAPLSEALAEQLNIRVRSCPKPSLN